MDALVFQADEFRVSGDPRSDIAFDARRPLRVLASELLGRMVAIPAYSSTRWVLGGRLPPRDSVLRVYSSLVDLSLFLHREEYEEQNAQQIKVVARLLGQEKLLDEVESIRREPKTRYESQAVFVKPWPFLPPRKIG